MKLLSDCKIAVCLSGQSRTFRDCSESIKRFFSSSRGNKFYFFGHTWNSNNYKVFVDNKFEYPEEDLDSELLRKDLLNHFNLEDLVISSSIANNSWNSSLKSAMISNFLKQKYEAENNMMFDCVVRARFDVCYRSDIRFDETIESIQEKALYSNFGFMAHEYYLPNPDDVIYSGSSLTMDIIDSIYNYTSNNRFFNLCKTNKDNVLYTRTGIGILLYKWSIIKNIMPVSCQIPYAVRRKGSENINYITDWDKLYSTSWFLK